MPCRSDYDDNNTEELRRTLAQLDSREAMLCGVLRALKTNHPEILQSLMVRDFDEDRAGVRREELQAWWRRHLANDARRMYAARDSLKLLLNKARYHTERVSHDLAFMKRLTRELRRESTDRPITAYVVYASLGKGKGSQQEILNSVRVLSYSNTPSTGALKWVPFPHDGEQHYLKFPATRDTEDEEELISLFKNAVIDERWEHAEDDAKLEDFDKDLDVNSQYTNIFVQKVQYDKETLKPVSVSVTGYSPYADPDGASPAHESREVEEDLDL